MENEDTIEDGSKKKREREAHITILKSEIKSSVVLKYNSSRIFHF